MTTTATTRRRVLITAPYFIPVVEDYRPIFEDHGIDVVVAEVEERLTETELLALIGDVDGVICGDDQFTAAVLERAPRLRVISKWGTGIDSIDATAARRLGVHVCNTPDAFTGPVAESVMGYVLCLARRIPWMDRDIREGRWRKLDAVSLEESTIGIIGVGHIGRAVALRAHAFGMRVLGTDPAPMPPRFVADAHITMTNLPDLLAESDFVSVNCDLNPTSYRLIDAATLALMRPGAFLINTARGPIVHEAALVDALRSGRLGGAALDVFEHEPLPASSPLRTIDSCLLAPHNSNASRAARRRVHDRTVRNLLEHLASG